MNKKRIFSMIMAVVMAFGLVACKNEDVNKIENEVPEVNKVLGWSLNLKEVEGVLPADVEEKFLAAIEAYGDSSFKPVAYVGFDEAGVAHRILCQRVVEEVHGEELEIPVDTEEVSLEVEIPVTENIEGNVENVSINEDKESIETEAPDFVPSPEVLPEMQFEPEMYMVVLVNDYIVEVVDVDFDMLYAMNQEDADRSRIDFEAAGWKYYLTQTASEMKEDVSEVLKVAPADIEPIHFMAVHGANDGTLTFVVMGRNNEELVLMFITKPVEGDCELANTVPLT